MSQNGRVRGGSVVFPLLLIGIGAMFLARQWMPFFNPWPVLWKYWPILLILVGAGMFWDRSQSHRDPEGRPAFPVGSMVGTILFLLLMTFLLWHGRAFEHRGWGNPSTHGGHQAETIDKQGAKAVRMQVEMPAGELRIEGGAEHLLQSDFSFGAGWGTPSVDYSVENGLGTLKIGQEGGGHFAVKSDNTWDLRVNGETPLELKIDVGAGRSELNLSKVDLTRLDVNIGAGQVNVYLTGDRNKDLQAVIHGGVGQAIVRLPKNMGVAATVHGGLGSIDVHGLKEEDGKYVNAEYGKSPNTLRLTVEGGIGQIQLVEE
jgi:hypothetical protein